jgi:hypothetical protein
MHVLVIRACVLPASFRGRKPRELFVPEVLEETVI